MSLSFTSLLDSNDSSLFGLSPPHDGSEADMMSESLFPDLIDGVTTTTNGNPPRSNHRGRHPSVSATTKKPIIQIKVPASQGTNFIKYIAGKFDKETSDSVMHLLQDGGNSVNRQSVGSLSPHSDTSEISLADSSQSFESPCMSKNAIAARENRQKKKMYIDGLEGSVKRLRSENDVLSKQVVDLGQAVNNLNEEVRYLRAVLANQGTLSALLKNIHNTKGVSITSSLKPQSTQVSTRKRKRLEIDEESCDATSVNSVSDSVALGHGGLSHEKNNTVNGGRVQRHHTVNSIKEKSSDHSYANQETESSNTDSATGGVCLHVSGTTVSLEFCARCSSNSSSGAI